MIAPDGTLRVKIAAPPTEGKANRELLSYLSETLGIPRSRLALVSGASGRHKVVEIDGLTVDEVRLRLGA